MASIVLTNADEALPDDRMMVVRVTLVVEVNRSAYEREYAEYATTKGIRADVRQAIFGAIEQGVADASFLPAGILVGVSEG